MNDSNKLADVPRLTSAMSVAYTGQIENERLRARLYELDKQLERLREALAMVRDADDDCHKDGLPTIPPMARRKIDNALEPR